MNSRLLTLVLITAIAVGFQLRCMLKPVLTSAQNRRERQK